MRHKCLCGRDMKEKKNSPHANNLTRFGVKAGNAVSLTWVWIPTEMQCIAGLKCHRDDPKQAGKGVASVPRS